ncbi:TPA: hypothetical protein DIS56_03450 [Candidatus Saccharibacteria bacterium]|nr:MAG: hypothetical protein UX30_C0005G0065 [Candidatus Saccharibacteria bacterium GW2011_GWA2_46_10]OGL34919.1 MAG: hypothetical protein A3F05_02205 [Candidatus Saccharibacteria bacterium RIFCSPHIGHO2_12_FULL_47_17]HCM52157.1 hypothetical protein [Candidatus Saccharibacteria bacterium]
MFKNKNQTSRHGSGQEGLGHVVLILAVVVVAVVGLAGWRVFGAKTNKAADANQTSSSQASKSGEKVTWLQTENGWTHTGNLPACPDPINLPVDINKVTSILYPGQYRGGEYKPHGGFRFDNETSNNVTISAPFDAEIVRGAHYSVGGDPQYVFDFIAPCGYMYRLGHLLTLSPKLKAIADELPVNSEGDSHDTQINPYVEFKAGETIATATGITKNGSGIGGINVFVDWGVYDLRSKNKASEDPTWAAKHTADTETHALCWFDLLSSENEAKVRALPPADGQSGKTSDYCK